MRTAQKGSPRRWIVISVLEEIVPMKKDLHPEYYKSQIRCACGNVIEVGSTKQDIRVEICSSCHPFFTGKQKLVDSEGRVERFLRKYKGYQAQA